MSVYINFNKSNDGYLSVDEINMDTTNDLECSVTCLSCSFVSWSRLQRDGIVTLSTWNTYFNTKQCVRSKPLFIKTKILSRKDVNILASTDFSTVYEYKDHAYKVINTSINRRDLTIDAYKDIDIMTEIVNIKANIREVCMLHSIQNQYCMTPFISEIKLKCGYFKDITHDMRLAKSSLHEYIRDGQYTIFSTLGTHLRQLIDALHTIHEMNLVHGDIKPSNILITKNDDIILTDFTLTSYENIGPSIHFGSFYWTPPEGTTMTKPSDVWSVGIIILDALYQCKFMEKYFKISKNSSKMKDITSVLQGLFLLEEEPFDAYPTKITLSTIEKKRLVHLLKRMLTYDPTERITIKEIIRDYSDILYIQTNINHIQIRQVKKYTPLSYIIKRGESEEKEDEEIIIQWTSKCERDVISQNIREMTMDIIQEIKNDIDDVHLEHVIDQSIITYKRAVYQLSTYGLTFNRFFLYDCCIKTQLFLWTSYYGFGDKTFESKVFHILTLLKFKLITKQVVHKYKS